MEQPLDESFLGTNGSGKTFNIVLRSVSTREEAEELIEILSKRQIVAVLSENSGDLDYVFQGEAPTNKFDVHIQEDDHAAAEEILIDIARQNLDQVEKDYYLFTFSNQELKDVLIHKNEWSEFDVLLSAKILSDRGITIDQAQLEEKRIERDQELAKPENGQIVWIVLGYFFSLLGGFLGLLIGYSLWKAKKKIPNGTKVPAYNEMIRRHGKLIFIISIFVFVLANVLQLLNYQLLDFIFSIFYY